MDLKIGQKVFITLPPSMMGFTIEKAFQIVEGKFVGMIGNHVLVTITFTDAPFKETVLTLEEDKIYVNLKEAIDKAYDKYSNHLKDAVDE